MTEKNQSNTEAEALLEIVNLSKKDSEKGLTKPISELKTKLMNKKINAEEKKKN